MLNRKKVAILVAKPADIPAERILRRMPEIFLAGVVPAAGCAALAEAPLVAILALAFAVAWALSLVPLALTCLALSVAKRIGPGNEKGPGDRAFVGLPEA